MSRTAVTLCTAIGLAGLALAAGDPAMVGSAAWAKSGDAALGWDISSAARRGPVVARAAPRAAPHINVARPVARPQFHQQVHVNRPAHVASQPRVRKFGGNTPGPGGGGPKFHKSPSGPANVQLHNPGLAHPQLHPAQVNPQLHPAVNNPQLHTTTPTLVHNGANTHPLKIGPGKVNPNPKVANFPGIKIGNKVAPIFKGPKKFWFGGVWKTFIPVSALTVVLVGGSYYYPDGYLSLARPYCEGVTDEGCRLNWQRVGFEGGGGEWQCVQFCPRPGAIPPPHAVALVAPPPAPPQGNCAVTIFAEDNFQGNGVPTSEEQPRLSESGWQNQIASIQVQSGTWDFYSDENFTGETMRLAPGPYPTLGQEWTKRIGSFMCSQP
jgi:hypothetical protein